MALNFRPIISTRKSVNDSMDSTLCSLSYPTIDNAITKIVLLGRNTWLAKVDIEHAYRNIPVHPTGRRWLGMQWDNQLFVDKVLPFGLCSASKIFSAVADALEWILCNKGVTSSIHYLDDFLTMGSAHNCQRNIQTILNCCSALGIPLKIQKIEGPSRQVTFLGILLDTVKMEIRLPDSKLDQLKNVLLQWRQRTKCKKRELLSLIGNSLH